MKQGHEGKSAGKFGKAMEAYLKALDDLVDSPDPLEGVVDEGSRSVNRCIATAAVIGDLRRRPPVARRPEAAGSWRMRPRPSRNNRTATAACRCWSARRFGYRREIRRWNWKPSKGENAYLEGEIDRRHEEIEALAKELGGRAGGAGNGPDGTARGRSGT